MKPAKEKTHGERDLLDEIGDILSEFVDRRRASGKNLEERLKGSVRRFEALLREMRHLGNKNRETRPLTYFKAFLDDKSVASITPSGKYLVERVSRAMDLRRCRVVVEYGAAAGVITRNILARLPASGRLVAVELNERLFNELRVLRDPRLTVVQDDVRQIRRILDSAGVAGADAIVSGVPFSMFRPRARHELLSATVEALNPGGRFVAYQVTPHLVSLLEDYFEPVRTEFELRNFPPHFVFTAFKPQ